MSGIRMATALSCMFTCRILALRVAAVVHVKRLRLYASASGGGEVHCRSWLGMAVSLQADGRSDVSML